jgi:hypothetical protein
MDALVSLNDPGDVRTYDETTCDRCEGPCSITEATSWRIAKEPEEFDRSYVEFWNNETGWGSFATATIFSSDEMETLNLPLDGLWVGS